MRAIDADALQRDGRVQKERGDGMSILIKGMEIPKRCLDCPFMVSRDNDDCILQTEVENELARTWEELKASCPLVEIPTPHGRLIDKDKLRHDLFVNFNGERIPFYDCDNFPTKIAYRDLHSILADQKTVIEAEGSEE